MRELAQDYGTPSPSPTREPEPTGKGGKGKGKGTQAWDECHRKKARYESSHIQLPSSLILAAAASTAEPEAPATTQASHAAVPAPFNAPEIGVDTMQQSMSSIQISPIPGALNNISGLQSSVLSMATQPSALSTSKALSSTIADKPAPPFAAPTTGADNRISLIVTIRVNAANVPTHLKAMPSQGNTNGSAPAPAFAPAPIPTTAASRAPSAAPTPSAMPAEAAEHGAGTRVYINTKVTYHLLAGMKELAKHKYVLQS